MNDPGSALKAQARGASRRYAVDLPVGLVSFAAVAVVFSWLLRWEIWALGAFAEGLVALIIAIYVLARDRGLSSRLRRRLAWAMAVDLLVLAASLAVVADRA